MLRFLNPNLATWLLIIPAVTGAWFLHARYKRRSRRAWSLDGRLATISRLSTWKRDTLVLALSVATVASLVFAMMRPQLVRDTRTPEFERQDLIVMLDRSASMRAQDIPPSRFARATREIRDFLKAKPEGMDRVGLVGFAGTSLILSHLTEDPDSLLFFLDWIEDDPQPLFGTDIAAALNSAREVSRKDDRPTPKILLVVSDGEDHGDQLARTLSVLREERTRVYCIGIGTEQDAPIPVFLPEGRSTFLLDERGRMIMSRFDETTLKWIASATGGRYYRSITGHELAAAMSDVVKRERRLVGWKTETGYRDIYRWGLLSAGMAALGLLLVL